MLLLGFPLLLVLGVLDAAPATGTPASVVLDVAFLAVVYAVATLLVYGGGRTRLRSA